MRNDDHSMPSKRVPSELLSAHHDGEATAEERAHIDRLMAESPEAQQVADDYRQLSQSLKELHASMGSPDLRDSVLSQLAESEASREKTPVPIFRRRVFQVVAGLSGLAAAVTLLLWTGPQARVGDGLAMNEPPGLSFPAEVTAGNEADIVTADIVTAEMADASAIKPAPSAAMSLSATEESSTADRAVDSPVVGALSQMEEAEASIASSLAALTQQKSVVQPGDVVRYLDQNAGELTLVNVTVADMASAGGQVQLFLSRHGFESPQGDDDSQAKSQQAGDYFVILVESDWATLEEVVDDLSDETFVQEVAVDAPVDESVPATLQGYFVRRADGSKMLMSSDSAKLMKQELASRSSQSKKVGSAKMTRSRQASSVDAENVASAGSSPADLSPVSNVQLPAAITAETMQRLADRRGIAGVEKAKRAGTPVPAAPSSAAQSALAQSSDKQLKAGVPLARLRVKTVFVIHPADK